jgi:hypothetical protein
MKEEHQIHRVPGPEPGGDEYVYRRIGIVRISGIIGISIPVSVLSSLMGEWSGRELELQDVPSGGPLHLDTAGGTLDGG